MDTSAEPVFADGFESGDTTMWSSAFGLGCTPPDTGCATGEQCDVGPGETFVCIPSGTLLEGQDCTTGTCQPGLTCVSDICRSFCDRASNCDEASTHCAWLWYPNITTWGACQPGCDPVTQTDCGVGDACYFEDPEIGSTLCWSEGSLPEGSPCLVDFCEKGLDCVGDPGVPGQYHCRAYCDVEHPCTSGTCQLTPLVPTLQVCIP
jgi:hypothetical protein